MSTPTTRHTLNEHSEFIPTPAGCMDCFTREDVYCGACDHTRLFVNIRETFQKLGFQHLDAGSFRSTWVRGHKSKYVFKVPHGHDGYGDNFFESLAWAERDNLSAVSDMGVVPRVKIGHRVARCSMLPNGVLVMERLDRARSWYQDIHQIGKRDPSIIEDQAQYILPDIDNCQGGFDSNNRFKLYDFAHRTEIDNIFSNVEAL